MLFIKNKEHKLSILDLGLLVEMLHESNDDCIIGCCLGVGVGECECLLELGREFDMIVWGGKGIVPDICIESA